MNIGSTKSCLKDYLTKFPSSKRLMTFVGISDQTERRWRNDKACPQGELLVRVQFFLLYYGYKIEELTRLHPDLLKTGECLALHIISNQEITERLRLGSCPQTFFAYFQGRRVIPATRMEVFGQIAEQYEADRTALRTKLIQDWDTGNKATSIQRTDPAKQSLNETIHAFADACLIVRTLGQQLLAGTLEDRVVMRSKIGEGREPLLHTTWETLNQLLKERQK